MGQMSTLVWNGIMVKIPILQTLYQRRLEKRRDEANYMVSKLAYHDDWYSSQDAWKQDMIKWSKDYNKYSRELGKNDNLITPKSLAKLTYDTSFMSGTAKRKKQSSRRRSYRRRSYRR